MVTMSWYALQGQHCIAKRDTLTNKDKLILSMYIAESITA